MSFTERVDVIYGLTGEHSDLLIILAPYLSPGRFFTSAEKTNTLYGLLKNSEIRYGKNNAVLITQLWIWNRYLRQMAELAQESIEG